MKRRMCLLYIICIALLGGCGVRANYKEVEQLQLVRTLGVDPAEGGLRLSISSGLAPQAGPGALLSVEAPTLTTAARKLHDYAGSKLLFFDHSRYLLLGEDFLSEDIRDLLYAVEQAPEMRSSILLFAVKGGSARELIGGCGGENYEISQVMDSLHQSLRQRSDVHAFTLAETARALNERGAALICALAPTDTEGTVLAGESGVTPIADGFGVLVGGALAAWLSPEEAMAAGRIMEFPGLSTLLLSGEDGTPLTLTVEGGRCRVTPRWEDDGLAEVSLALSLKASISESGRLALSEDPRQLQALETQLAGQVEAYCRAVLDKCHGLGADFLGLSRALRAADARRFDALDSDWPGDCRFSVKVSARIDQSAGSKGDEQNDAG